MNLGFRNVRGLQETPKQREVSTFILNSNMDIFGLLETKLTMSTLGDFKKNNLKNLSFIENFSTARNGRILLVWNPARLDVNVSIVEPQVIHAKVECLVSGNKFHLAMCYGRNHLQDRHELWDSLISHAPTDEPLLVCGDFNNVMEQDERIVVCPPIEREVRELVDTAAYLNLQDYPSTGCFYIWANSTIFSRIDRLMYNNAWLEEGWMVKTHFHTRGVLSDHSECTAELFNPIKRFRRDFKYCNF